ncbi:hypothetical protein Ppb6_02820 [Photorhabdus australis subsp. thailandensis]|uniref:Uncharacterized protein n=1 Tax=Photorhabdus australis subsp. thailandensis TaxID=2805096 RepID=A0A1C0U2E1_9GAMM|nr:hypothetical protein [Photorhabdus australis]OCQ52026.1 hypothetical protein Ppb6_02820 [Photorhabdus australis subsp. thailandensis]
MPVNPPQHRAVAGNYQNLLHEENVPNDISQLASRVVSVRNSAEPLHSGAKQGNVSESIPFPVINRNISSLVTTSVPLEISGSSSKGGDDYHNLKKMINDAFKEKLPQLMEYRRKGYNIIGLDEEGIKQLEGMLKAVPPEQPLYSATQNLLNTLKQHPLLPENQDMIQQSNSVIRNLNNALEAMNAAGKVSQVTWKQEVDRIARLAQEKWAQDLYFQLGEEFHH